MSKIDGTGLRQYTYQGDPDVARLRGVMSPWGRPADLVPLNIMFLVAPKRRITAFVTPQEAMSRFGLYFPLLGDLRM